MQESNRRLDIVVWGATGFTGKMVVAAINGYQDIFYSCKLPNAGKPMDIKFGIAGRNAEKLKTVLETTQCSEDVEIFIADANDVENITKFVKQTKVVIACAGPFAKYSDTVVGICAQNGTHFVDITGEVPWVRSVIDRYDNLAKATGACIVNMCGFDSIPFDVGTLFGINRLRYQVGKPNLAIRRSTAHVSLLGGMSGGSVATGLNDNENPVMLTAGIDNEDPFLLGGIPKGGIREEDTDDYLNFVGQLGNKLYTCPSGMHNINSRVVRRSASLLNWGHQFNYTEFNFVPLKKIAEKSVQGRKHPAPPNVIRRLIESGRLPKPGEGPKPAKRAKSRFDAILTIEGEDGSTIDVSCNGGEAGYEETARMLLEAGLSMVHEPLLCPGIKCGGGVLTPAAALGENLIRRLNHVGIKFEVVPNKIKRAEEFSTVVSKL
eukprot:g7942.t1